MCRQVDFNKLLKEVDEGFYTWRKPTALCFGSSDPFLDVSSVFDFLESKRTNMKAMSIGAKVRNAWLQQVYWLVPVHLHLFACGEVLHQINGFGTATCYTCCLEAHS